MPPCDADAVPPGPPARPAARTDRDAPASLALALTAEMAAPWLVRNRLRTWLEALSWPAHLVDDVEYALSEAVSNVAEHAYGDGVPAGPVEVWAEVESQTDGSRRLRIRIRDRGRWQPVDPDPAHRGRGLFMMAVLMDEVIIHRGDGPDDDGTEIVLLSPAAPPPPDDRPAGQGGGETRP